MQRRAAGALLVAGAGIFFAAEFISAAAWRNPPYSYTYHYISNLGVYGPLEALGQVMRSPLAWVMNTGFFAFGVTELVGVAMLKGLRGWRRWATLSLATLMGTGSVMIAFFPGTGEEIEGAGDYHALGALASIAGGNLLVILLGSLHPLIGIAREPGRAMVALGAFGLVSLPAFLVVAGSGANILVGLVERCAVYPLLIGFICGGVSIWSAGARKH